SGRRCCVLPTPASPTRWRPASPRLPTRRRRRATATPTPKISNTWTHARCSYSYTYAHSHVAAGDLLLCGGTACGYSSNVDPRNGGILRSGGFDPDLDAQLTHELLLSAEHALLPEFVVGLNLTYRKISNILEYRLNVFDNPDPHRAACLGSIGRQATPADYEA